MSADLKHLDETLYTPPLKRSEIVKLQYCKGGDTWHESMLSKSAFRACLKRTWVHADMK